ncbi:unnamed protein product [Adineta steineri]|uniref:Uncharacterized protein n=1 Tax=Adineta steineri TaxID=433720 RepID=A0A819H0E8_9BILA|nr:unnamed protein product [Adineta steineri]
MKRSIVINNSNDNNQINDTNKQQQQRKRSLENNTSIIKFKKRRHFSPQSNNHSQSSSIVRNKSKKRSSVNDSIVETKTNSQTSRKSSSRRQSYSIEHLAEITLPNWECISSNIDQILSNKHTQSGVYAHEVHLVQQELEALLSMSIVRENLLQDLLHPNKIINNDNTRSKIRQHQQAEYIYSSNKILNKSLPPLINQTQQRHHSPNLLLDRQVTITPIIGTHIDKIWSDINTYYRKISSNDILTIRHLVEFNQQLEEKIHQYKTEYKNNILTQSNITEQLNEENFQELINITQTNPLISNYVDRTSIGHFQNKLYDRMPQTSPVYKTPVSSPFYRKSFGSYLDNNSSLRSSPRLHSHHRIGLGSLSNLKSNDDHDRSLLLKSKKNIRMTSISPPLSIKFQERAQLVHDYLTDQHPLTNVKRQLFNDIKSTKKRKSSLTIHNNHCTDIFESKLSTLISLLHESSTLCSYALDRANLQSNNEQTWQKLNTIEHDMELLLKKIELTGDNTNSINLEKTYHTLGHLLKDWKKYEDNFDQQTQILFTDNN